jgi:hypothetical protein
MTKLHTLGLDRMIYMTSGMNGKEIKRDLPLALWAKDTNALQYLYAKGISINPSEAERRGHPAVIVYAAGRLDASMVEVCLWAPVPAEDIKAAIIAAAKAGIERAVSPFKTVTVLQNGRPREEMKEVAVAVKGLFKYFVDYHTGRTDVRISHLQETSSGLAKTIELLLTGKIN